MKKLPLISALSVILVSCSIDAQTDHHLEKNVYITLSEDQKASFGNKNLRFRRNCQAFSDINLDLKYKDYYKLDTTEEEREALRAVKRKASDLDVAVERTLSESARINTSFGEIEAESGTVLLMVKRTPNQSLKAFRELEEDFASENTKTKLLLSTVDQCFHPQAQSDSDLKLIENHREFQFSKNLYTTDINRALHLDSVNDRFEIISEEYWGGFAFYERDTVNPHWVAFMKQGAPASDIKEVKKELELMESEYSGPSFNVELNSITLNEKSLYTRAERDAIEISILRKLREALPDINIQKSFHNPANNLFTFIADPPVGGRYTRDEILQKSSEVFKGFDKYATQMNIKTDSNY